MLPAVRIKLALIAEPIIAAKAKERMLATQNNNTAADLRKSLRAAEDICPQLGENENTNTPFSKIKKVLQQQQSDKDKKEAIRQNKTNYQVAQIAGVSDKSVQRYKKIQQKAAPEVVAKVDSGEMSINEGYKHVKQAEKQQIEN